MIDWWKLFWVMLPAGIANMVPPMAAKIWPRWNIPLDGGKSWRDKRIFGDHKTVRGMVAGIIVAELVFLLLKNVLVSEVGRTLPWYFGAAMGLGGLGGDAIKSFFKRRAGVASGVSWFPWDQIDWIVGMVLMSRIWNLLSYGEMGMLLLAGMALHLLFKVLGYLLRLNSTAI